MDDTTFLFVYSKGSKIKTLTAIKLKQIGEELEEDGWIHTATLDPCVWMDCLHNQCNDEDILDKVKSLSSEI